jgi:hypothetical protein
MFATVSIKKFPRGILDQVISLINPDGENESVHLVRASSLERWTLPAPSNKLQAPSIKHQAFEPTRSIAKRQASQPE